jgi:hypothetical protein
LRLSASLFDPRVLAGVVATGVVFSAALSGQQAAASTGSPAVGPGSPGKAHIVDGAQLSEGQRAHAATIITIGKQLGIPRRGWVVALATAMQESKLRMYANSTVPGSLKLPHEDVGSDHDSVGLFQQRASWGSIAERMNAGISARLFYQVLATVPGWRHMPLTVAAQTVQRSAFPNAYAQWEPLAADLVATLSPVTGHPGGGSGGPQHQDHDLPDPSAVTGHGQPEDTEQASAQSLGSTLRSTALERIFVLRGGSPVVGQGWMR